MPPLDRPETDTPLMPVRGLVPMHVHTGRYRGEADLRRWLLLQRVQYKCAKVDLYDAGYQPELLKALCAAAREHDCVPSFRTACQVPPGSRDSLGALGLGSLFLSPAEIGAETLQPWLDAAQACEIPLRIQFPAGKQLLHLDDKFIARIAAAKPVMVQVAVDDFLAPGAPCTSPDETRRSFAIIQWLAQLPGVEFNLLGFPTDALPGLRHRNAWQAARDHQQYNAASLALARTLYFRRAHEGATVALYLLGRRMSRLSQIDNFVLARTLHIREGWLSLLMGLHRLTRLRGSIRSVPGAMEALPLAIESAMPPGDNAVRAGELSPQERDVFLHCFPGYKDARNEPGAPDSVSAHPRYYDPVDAERLQWTASHEELAREARRITNELPFAREIKPDEYRAENAHTLASPSANRWCSIANVEKRSTQLGQWEPPFTLRVTVGGGHAEYAGFAFGAHARVLCPMETFDHTLTLHVSGDGRYVLLRDGKLIRPVEFTGRYFVPRRLGGRLDPRLCFWNIDGDVFSQAVLFWPGPPQAQPPAPVKYSAVIVCTRYARRLQATLISLAKQRGFDLAWLEIIVAYAPGVDATDDVIDSVSAAFPSLRILRSPFSEDDAKQKGMLINETAALAAGEWLVLLDADTVLAPDAFARVEAVEAGAHFIAPDGRKMLDRETTAKILLGEIDPAAHWQALLDGPGEWRRREAASVPIGFCQFVRKRCFDAVRYEEHGHFEGADWRFAQAIRERFGPETWLDGLPALHLDHGASNWYGAKRHY